MYERRTLSIRSLYDVVDDHYAEKVQGEHDYVVKQPILA